jgi:hypothetical protein
METKKFDAVQFMRQVRDKMGADMSDMSFEEQKAYIEQHASKVRRDLETRTSKPGPAGGGIPHPLVRAGGTPALPVKNCKS